MAIPVESLHRIRYNPFLTDCTNADLDAIADLLEEARFPKDSRLFDQGAAGDSMYLILSGQVAVVRRLDLVAEGSGARRSDHTLAAVGPGEAVGEMALVDGEPRSASVVALEDVIAARLDRERYDLLRAANPRLAIRLLLGLFRTISWRVRQANKNLEMVQYRLFTI
jgi:CRP/FNR family transcriptional regulator/CRP/FNR family cyclic AMP-dependent transcriptional regulator